MKKIILLLFVIFTLNNGVKAQWTEVNTGLPYPATTEYETFASIGTNLFVGTGSGVYVTSDEGANWTSASSGLTNTDIEMLATMGTNLFAATGNGIFKSVDNGANWTSISTGLNTANGTSVYSLFASGSNMFAGTEAGVFKSVSPYTSWTAVNTGLPLVDYYAFAQIGSYMFSGGLGVYRTSDNGANWAEVTSGLPAIYDSDFESFAVLGSDVFAGDLGLGVFKSTDNGTNWTAVNSGLTDLHTQALTVNGTNLFAGGLNGGVFLSNDNGASWTPENTGLTNLEVLCLQSFGTYMYAGTRGGVFRAPLSYFAGINEMQNENVHLTVFPNPSNGTLQITHEGAKIKTIEIYNVMGKLVQQEETINDNIEVSALTAGMYIIKVIGDNWTVQKKLIKE